MYGTIINHIIFINRVKKKWPFYLKNLKILYISTGWHNDAFALISGIVGYKTNKYSNLLYLWFYVIFYSVGIHLFFKIFWKNMDINYDFSKEFFPIIYKRYWYFTAYFGMFLFLPAVNKGISLLSKKELIMIILSVNFLFAFWRDLKNPYVDVFGLNGGMSLLWILSFYFTGAYIGKYRVDYHGFKKYLFCAICIFIFVSLSYLFYKIYHNELYLGNSYFPRKIVSLLKQLLTDRYDSILKIINSITIILFFMQIHYNRYIAKFICFLGHLAFGIYLIHVNPLIFNKIIIHIFDNESNYINGNTLLIIVSLKALKIFVLCIFFDYFRNLLLV
jgi:hypothetical protein